MLLIQPGEKKSVSYLPPFALLAMAIQRTSIKPSSSRCSHDKQNILMRVDFQLASAANGHSLILCASAENLHTYIIWSWAYVGPVRSRPPNSSSWTAMGDIQVSSCPQRDVFQHHKPPTSNLHPPSSITLQSRKKKVNLSR